MQYSYIEPSTEWSDYVVMQLGVNPVEQDVQDMSFRESNPHFVRYEKNSDSQKLITPKSYGSLGATGLKSSCSTVAQPSYPLKLFGYAHPTRPVVCSASDWFRELSRVSQQTPMAACNRKYTKQDTNRKVRDKSTFLQLWLDF